MNRLTEGWFSFGGIRCDDMHLCLMEMPKRRRAKRRGEYQHASGTDGDTWKSDGTYEAYDIPLRCETTDGYDETAIRAWLDGSGELIFSDERGLAYDAEIHESVDFISKYLSFDKKTVTLIAHVQPFKRMIPAVTPIVLTSGRTITNPGTIYSLPKITVQGSGDFSLTVGGQVMYMTGISGGVVLDSQLMDAFDFDGNMVNDYVSGKFFRIQPGENNISWQLESGAKVSSVTIEPRWRCI